MRQDQVRQGVGHTTYGKKRSDCDKEFRSDMLALCRKTKGGARCRNMAKTFYQFVDKLGKWEFHRNTRKRCWYPDRMTTKAERKKIGQCRQEMPK